MKKAGANWVDGDSFFDREDELNVLADRVREGTHTLVTAQRRMGKTSLIRELLRRLEADGTCETVFVDLEDAVDPADAIAEIATRSKPIDNAWRRIRTSFADMLEEISDRIDTIGAAGLRLQLRSGMAAGNQWRKGDGIFEALCEGELPVVLAIDELPIFVNRLIQGRNDNMVSDGRSAAAEFLSWLRKNGQTHRDRIVIILSGSVGLEPILQKAGLGALANIYMPLHLQPWSEDIAVECLAALAETYNLELPLNVRGEMCRRLRHLVPHHIQQYFHYLHEHLRNAGRAQASLDDVGQVYENDMLSVRGQVDLEHYEGRLRMVLTQREYRIALGLLTEAAVGERILRDSTVAEYRKQFVGSNHIDEFPVEFKNILHLLVHDGYLQQNSGGYQFVSGLLEDWWHARHGMHFVSLSTTE